MPNAKEQLKLDRNYEIYRTRQKIDRAIKIMTRYLSGEQFNVICHSFDLSPNRMSNVYREGYLLIKGGIEKGEFSLPVDLDIRDLINKSIAQHRGDKWIPVIEDLLKKVLERKITAINEKFANDPTPSKKNHDLQSKTCART